MITTDQIDEALDVAAIDALQQAYFELHGQYEGCADCPFDCDPNVFTRIDAYDGPQGKGYQLMVYSVDIPFMKIVNMGPEDYRELAWCSYE